MFKVSLLIFSFLLPFIAYSQSWVELNDLSLTKYGEGNIDEAIKYSIEALNSKNIADSNYATSANNLGFLYDKKQDFKQSEKYYLIALEKRKEIYGEDHARYSETLRSMTSMYRFSGDLAKAESTLKSLAKIEKKLNGEQTQNYANYTRVLGVINYEMGKYAISEKYFLEAKTIFYKLFGEENLEYAYNNTNLAILYTDLGRYKEAEELLINSSYTYIKLLGEKHPEFATLANNLGRVYINLTVFDKAETYLLKAAEILSQYSQYYQEYLSCMNNLGTLYSMKGDFDKAIKYKSDFKENIQKIYGKEHPIYATAANNLGTAYYREQMYEKAEPLINEALKIWEIKVGKNNPDYLKSAINLASIYYIKNEKDKSLQHFLETESKWEETFGKNHPLYIIIIKNLAELYFEKGDFKNADKYYELLNSGLYYNIDKFFAFLSEHEKDKFIENIRFNFEKFNNYVLTRCQTKPEITGDSYNNELKNKGLSLRSSNNMKNSILASKDTVVIWHYNNWLSMKTELSNLYSAPKSAKNDSLIKLYEFLTDGYEKELNKASAGFRKNELRTSWQDVQRSLKENEAAIEFTHFKDADYKTIYCALILTKKLKVPIIVKLFEEDALEKLIKKEQNSDIDFVSNLYGKIENENSTLYNLIWKPIESYLSGISSIYYSPSGYLHKISFSSIKISATEYLSDKYKLNNVSTTGLIVEYKDVFKLNNDCDIKLFGGITYDLGSKNEKVWQYLPGTKIETENIAKLLNDKNFKTSSYIGNTATETEFKSYSYHSPCLIHIATHGFFFPEPENEAKEEKHESGEIDFRGYRGFGVNAFVQNTNPLMRSGLVFAGANDIWTSTEQNQSNDGILTAYEVSNIDLSNTKLAVMSACETGLGDIKGSEGVYGLQRAFKMAGVQYLIISLWQVPDKETMEFMTSFYQKLSQSQDVRDAFNNTQKEMRQKYDPYFWAAFVLIE